MEIERNQQWGLERELEDEALRSKVEMGTSQIKVIALTRESKAPH